MRIKDMMFCHEVLLGLLGFMIGYYIQIFRIYKDPYDDPYDDE